jgi:5'/3'-nucleotidase SurE
VVAAGAADEPQDPPPLRVLLTNDDGVGYSGLATMRGALCDAGYDVTVVGPSTNQSGVGARITASGTLTVTQTPFPCGDRTGTTWSVSGSPADSVLFGHVVVFGEAGPDLVISGINPGNNTATSGSLHSGTVGAALTAATLGIPAMAISVGTVPGRPELQPLVEPHAAATVLEILGRLEATRDKRDGRLMPRLRVLNVNYPLALNASGEFDPSLVGGYAWTHLTTNRPPVLTYNQIAPDQWESRSRSCGPTVECPVDDTESDTYALAHNRISVAPLRADFSAEGRPWPGLRKLFEE